MGYLSDLAKKRAEKRGMSAKNHDEYLATLSNDGTSADEMRRVFKWIVLPLFFIWVAYVGYIHLSKELIGVVPAEHVFWMAIAIPLTFQFLKAYCATKCLRAFHFKWYDESAQDFWLYTMLAVLTIFAFIWTLKISFWDVKETAKNNYVEQHTISLESHLSAATSDIDTRLKSLNDQDAANGSVRTKSGRTNWAVQPIATKNAETRALLESQRETLVRAATEEFNANKSKIEAQAQNRGDFFQRFGGWGEVGEIICFIIIGLLEAKLHRMNSGQSTPPPSPQPTSNGQQHHNGQTHAQTNNSAQRYYFNRTHPSGNVQAALTPQPLFPDENAVAQPPQTVPQQNTTNGASYADSVIEVCRQAIQRDMSNFDNRQAKNPTVARRIHEALDTCYNALKQRDFAPSYQIGLRLYNYLQETVWPRLNGIGHPYPNQTFFTERLYHAFKPQEQTT